MSEKIALYDNVSFNNFRAKHVAGVFGGLGGWYFGWKEGGSNT